MEAAGENGKMRIAFVSNYINHHQLPFCEQMREALGDDFLFIQTEKIEEERLNMGWEDLASSLPWVLVMTDNKELAREWIKESDVVIAGWCPAVDILIRERLEAGRLTFRMSERLYRTGRWKAISPRGLIQKYRDFTKFKDAPYYLLTAGAYVASDFALVHAFPDKMLRWGYFPPLRTYGRTELSEIKNKAEKPGVTNILWAGRFLKLKHPDMVLRVAKKLSDDGEQFVLHMAGGGELEEELHAFVRENGLEDKVFFQGFASPGEVRDMMEQCSIFLFTSDHNEGWGAVVNEAMNSGCAVVAGSRAGAVPVLLQNGVNGIVYNGTDENEVYLAVRKLLRSKRLQRNLGTAAAYTITQTWNAEVASDRFLWLCEQLLDGKLLGDINLPQSGPLSRDPAMKPFLKIPKEHGVEHL